MGKFGEGENSELSTFLFLFFFLRNFFPPSADDFTILGGGRWRFWLLLPPPPNSKCRTKSCIPQEARASDFPKDEVASPPAQPGSPPPVSSPQPRPGRPGQAGRRPRHILPLSVMLQKLKTHLCAGRPPSVSSREVAEEAPGLSSMPRGKCACRLSTRSPWAGVWDWTWGRWLSHTMHTTPASPGV